MKKQYVKAETEIVPMKIESLMGVTGTVEEWKPGEGDPDPGRPGRGARAHNDDDDMEYFFDPATPLSTEEE